MLMLTGPYGFNTDSVQHFPSFIYVKGNGHKVKSHNTSNHVLFVFSMSLLTLKLHTLKIIDSFIIEKQT